MRELAMSPLKIAIAVIGLSIGVATTAIAETPSLPSRRAQLDDLAVFRAQFLAVDRSYSPAARTEAERRLALLAVRAGTESAAEFAIELCRITALADNGHTQCVSIPHSEIVPLQFLPIDGNFYVVATTADNADLLGARLISIDDTPFSSIRESVRSMHGDFPFGATLTEPNFSTFLSCSTGCIWRGCRTR
jgi:hypothetical protein